MLDTQYFKVEHPADWKVDKGNNPSMLSYSLPQGGGMSWLRVGLNGVDIRLTIGPLMFNEDGSINESVIHFFETFQVKKSATTNVTAAPEYKIYENEYFKVEFPADWIVYPNEKEYSYHFQVPIQSWGGWTNVTWNVECFDPAEVSFGMNGATVLVQANKDTGSFLNDGFVNKSLIHFLKTFKVKSYPTPVL
jgi:hypothetical protein